MTPPRALDLTADPGAAYDEVIARIAEVQGIINIAEAELVQLIRRGIDIGVSGGSALTPQAWVAWRTGMAPERAYSVALLAERADELPATIAALDAGELTVDQAGEIARNVPARYEASAAEVARSCTVRQLRSTLPHYRDPKPTDGSPPKQRREVSTGVDEHGWWARMRLPEAEGAIVDQALQAMRDDLRRQAKDETPHGDKPEPVTAADALVALAEVALRTGEATRPGTERYLVHVHLEAGPHGLQLMTHLGLPLPDGQRRHILCDAALRGLVHDDHGTPLGAGRKTRHINRRLRRAIQHRDGRCTVPGCGRTTGLEIHHIWHWEDGGPTETWNLLTLCWYHHARHHDGTLGIEGNADHPRHTAPGIVFTDRWGNPLGPTGTPIIPRRREPGQQRGDHLTQTATAARVAEHTYQPPTGERLDRWQFHLNETPPPPAEPPDAGAEADEPSPETTGRRPRSGTESPIAPGGATSTDPTRAGPTPA